MTVGDGFVAYKNRTASGRVTLNREQEDRWRNYLMWGGNQQGGGGNEFVNLTGLFMSKTGKSMVGSIKPDEFNTLFAVMQECHKKGVEMVFVVSGPGNAKGKVAGRLAVTVGRGDRQAEAPKAAPAGPFGPAASAPVAPVATVGNVGSPFSGGGSIGTQANNPPKDELEKFLEGFGN